MRGTAARLESTRASELANSQAQIDVAVFTQWVDAYASGKTQLRDFYFRRFRPEFKPAVVAWIATRPVENPAAPLTLFAMPQYTSKARDDAARLEAQADAWATTARRNVQRSTNYVLGVVLFATAPPSCPPGGSASRCCPSASSCSCRRSCGSPCLRSASRSDALRPAAGFQRAARMASISSHLTIFDRPGTPNCRARS